MGLGFLTNVSALEATQSIERTQNALLRSVARLASGRRIFSAADDPAGLAIGSRLAAQLGGLQQASRNASQSLSLVQTADGGLSDIGDLLTRMQQLAVQSANGGTLNPADRSALNTEFAALQSEVSRIAGATSYNGQALIDGSLSGGVNFFVSAESGSNATIAFLLGDASANALGVNVGQIDIASQTDAAGALGTLGTAIDSLSNLRTATGAVEARLQVAQSNLTGRYQNLSVAKSAIVDVQVAEETVKLASHAILLQAGIAVLAQANQRPALLLSLLR